MGVSLFSEGVGIGMVGEEGGMAGLGVEIVMGGDEARMCGVLGEEEIGVSATCWESPPRGSILNCMSLGTSSMKLILGDEGADDVVLDEGAYDVILGEEEGEVLILGDEESGIILEEEVEGSKALMEDEKEREMLGELEGEPVGETPFSCFLF
jgi:hypothetical protein